MFGWDTVIYIIIYAALIAASVLLTPKPDVESARPAHLGDFQFPTATEGRAIPVTWGTVRLKGPNVVWFGDLLHHRVVKDGITLGYKYYVAIDFAICFGPVNRLTEIEIGSGQRPSVDFLSTAVSTSPNTVNVPAHGYGNGYGPVRITGTGTLPGGLNNSTSYFLRKVTVDDFAFYLTRADAKADVNRIDLTSQGTGTNTLRDYGRIAFSGEVGGDGNVNGNLITIDYPKFFGGEGEGGGLRGQLRFYDGVSNQAKNAYLVSVLGSDVPAYVNVCHAVWERGFDSLGRDLGLIGERTHIEPWAFEIERFPDNLSLTGSNHIVNGGDANPAEVLYEIFTNNVWGLGRPTSTLNFTSFQTAGNTLFTEGNGFSMVLDQTKRAEEVIEEVLRQIGGSLYQDTSGIWTLKLVRNDYSLGSLPTFDDTNIVELSDFTRGSWESTSNDVSVGFVDRTNDYKETFAMGQDIANFNIQGGVKSTAEYKAPGVKFPATAKLLAEREIRSLAFPHAKATLVVDRTGSTLNPGDVFKLTWPALGIVQMPMRVARINKGELLDGKITIDAMQDVFGLGATIYDAPPTSGWFPSSTALLPFTTQAVLDAPKWFAFTGTIPAPTTGERVLALGKRPSGTHTDFRLDVDPGSGYVEVGVSATPAFTPAGLLDVDLAEDTADIFSTGAVVNTATDFTDVVAATAARIESDGVNLLLIDSEILAFETASYNTSNGKWTLGNLHRGLLDTLPAAHTAGATVWVLTEEIAGSGTDPRLGMVPSLVSYGATASLNAKLLTENASGTLPLSSATALPLTMSRRSEKPLPVGQFRVSTTVTTGSARYPRIVPDADVTIAWNHRHRQDPKILDQNDGDSTLGLDSNTTYEYTWFVLDSGSPVQVRQATQTTTSFAYTRATQTADNGAVPPQALRARLRSKDTSLVIDSRVDVIRDFEVFDVQNVAVDLNGTDETLRSLAATIGIANAWSIAFWIKRTDSDTVKRALASLGTPTGLNSVNFIRPSGASSDLLVEVRDSAGTLFKARTAASALTSSAWVHVCATFDGAAGGDPLIVYINGSAASLTGTDTTGTMTDTSRRINLGSDSALGNFAAGIYHSLGIWSSTLSAAEVTAIYNGGNGSDFNLNYNHNGYASKANLKQWFRLGLDSSPDADIGKQYALTPTGTHNVMDSNQNVTAADVVSDAP